MSKTYPILLLHGALGSKTQFLETENILNIKAEAYSLNFRGHGGDNYDGPFEMDLFVEDIERFLTKNNIQKVNIFGYSMGGYAAICFAQKYPESVGKIMTLATKFEWTPETSQKEASMLDAEKIEVNFPLFAKELNQRFYPEDWKLALFRTAEMIKNLGSKPPLTDENFSNIKSEILVCVGSLDSMVTIEETKHVAGLLKNGKYLILEGWKHPFEKVDKIKLKEGMFNFFKD